MATIQGTPVVFADGDTYTAESGGDRLLVLAIAKEASAVEQYTSVTFGGVELTPLVQASHQIANSTPHADIWYLAEADIPAGSNAIVAVPTQPTIRGVVYTLTNANQSPSQGVALGGGTDAELTGQLTGLASSDLVIAIYSNVYNNRPAAWPSELTSRYIDNANSSLSVGTADGTGITGTYNFSCGYSSGSAADEQAIALAVFPSSAEAPAVSIDDITFDVPEWIGLPAGSHTLEAEDDNGPVTLAGVSYELPAGWTQSSASTASDELKAYFLTTYGITVDDADYVADGPSDAVRLFDTSAGQWTTETTYSPIVIDSATAGPFQAGDTLTITHSNASAGGKTYTIGGLAVTEVSQNAATSVLTIPDPKAYGAKTLSYNADLSIVVTDNGQSASFVRQIEPDTGHFYGTVTDQANWIALGYTAVVDGDNIYAIRTSGTGVPAVETASFPENTTWTIYIQDQADDVWGSSDTLTIPSAADATAPVITLIGSSTITVAHGSTYNDAGATASDDTDGDITADIQVTGSVNTSSLGAQVLTYNVSDAAGNAATPVTRTVTITDQTIPTITLTGNATVNLTAGDTYTEQGATWTDNVDGSGAVSNITGSVNTSVADTYNIAYNFTDAAGLAATEVVRTVIVAAADVVPDQFSLGADVTDAEPSATTQRQFTIAGIDGGETVNITAVGGATLSAVTGQLNDVITVSLDASASFDGVVTGGATINGISDSFSITTRAQIVPTVSTQPTAQSVTEGQAATFTAAFTSAASIQWYDASDDSVLSGETSTALVINTVLADDGNVYYAIATSSDAATVQTNTAALTVTAGAQAPVMPSVASISVDEGVTAAGTYTASSGTSPITYALTGADATNFGINASTGAVTFNTAPDYETKASYSFNVAATNSAGSDSQSVTIAINNVLEDAPAINTGGSTSITLTVGDAYTDPAWTATDDVGSVTVTWSGDIVDTATAGTYTRTATATNAIGSDVESYTVTVSSAPVADYIPRLLNTDVKEVTVFKTRGNRFSVAISHNGSPIDLSVFTRFELYGLTDSAIDSDVAANVIDWNDGGGVINIDAGETATVSGTAKTTLIGYSAAYPEGVVLWHPSLAQAHVTVNLISA